MPSFVQTDNFLFSDDDVGGSDAIAFVKVAAGEPDVVPDSSDEASTGPALDMDLQAEETSMGRDAFYEGKQDNHDSYAHMEASSHTRQGLFTRFPCDVIEG